MLEDQGHLPEEVLHVVGNSRPGTVPEPADQVRAVGDGRRQFALVLLDPVQPDLDWRNQVIRIVGP
jgi:hypothetical protein